jgi:hypothetical protein
MTDKRNGGISLSTDWQIMWWRACIFEADSSYQHCANNFNSRRRPQRSGLLQNTQTTHSSTHLTFDIHMTVHHDKFPIIKPTTCTNFSNLFLEWNSTCFGQCLCPSSGVFRCTHSNGICHTGLLTACEQEHLLLLTSCQQTCMTYTIAVYTVRNFWWWTEELSETCRVSFQE